MNRGDRREPIFKDDADRERFVETLGEACGRSGWQVQAYCLMPNHFHLVVETPQPTVVAGMKWFLGTYTGRFNRLPVRAARRQGGTRSLGTCSAFSGRSFRTGTRGAGGGRRLARLLPHGL
jgi:REP element-mobilizing transposase RayT